MGVDSDRSGADFFAGLYTIVGGLRAVMLTDVLQAIVLLMSAAFIAVGVYREFDFSISQMVSALPSERLSVIRPIDDPDMPWTGLLTGVPILGLYYWAMNHYIAQRFFAARDVREAQRGALLGAALKLTPLFLMVLPGALAVVLLPDLQRADEVFPALIANFLPDGLRGLAIVGVMAAIMSTVDSTINASAAMISYDFMEIDHDQRQTPHSLVTHSLGHGCIAARRDDLGACNRELPWVVLVSATDVCHCGSPGRRRYSHDHSGSSLSSQGSDPRDARRSRRCVEFRHRGFKWLLGLAFSRDRRARIHPDAAADGITARSVNHDLGNQCHGFDHWRSHSAYRLAADIDARSGDCLGLSLTSMTIERE